MDNDIVFVATILCAFFCILMVLDMGGKNE